MDLRFTTDEQAFRDALREFFSANLPGDIRERMRLGHAPTKDDTVTWQRILNRRSWAAYSWPKEYGGPGWTPVQRMIFLEENQLAPAPEVSSFNITMIGPVLIQFGTEEQKQRFLPRAANIDDWWCQGFSEPGAGSDLAALQTRGEVDGDHVVVNGVKMWTTDAQYADYQELLVRTAPGSQRHKGLSWLICDMHTPGIDVKPIRTMLGDEHVSMVFYDHVRVPLANVVGGLGDGWATALSTLAFERGLGFIGDQLELYERVLRAIELAGRVRLEDGTLAIDDAGIAQRLAALKAETMAIRAMTLADIAETDRTGTPGPKGSLMKLEVTGVHKALSELVGDMLGWDFMEFDGDRTAHPWTYEYLWSWVFTIAGGTSEIQREIAADRLLGLPRAR